MTGPTGSDPIEELRRANPVDTNRLPSASLARVRARVTEDLMHDPGPVGRRSPIGPARPFALGALATTAVLVLAVALLRLVPQSPGHDPSAAPPQVGGCLESYTLETLQHRAFAFDGTVTRISGDQVTFQVWRAFRGHAGPDVSLTATGLTGGVTTAGGLSLEVGGRYLVAGDDRFVWACGFTQPYDSTVAASWAQALGS